MADTPSTPPQAAALIGRPHGAALFRTPGGPITAQAFLDAAHRLAGELPDGRYVLNLCRHRSGFAAAFAAAMLRGQVSLLTSDRSPERLAALAEDYPGLSSVSDDPDVEGLRRHHLMQKPLPQAGMAAGMAASGSPNPLLPADQPAAVVFTSGSTGRPAAHVKLWGGLVARSRAAGLQFGFGAPARTVVGTVPPQHMYGFETTVLLPLHAEVASWCGPAFYPADIRAALAAAPDPAVLVTTPLQLRAFLDGGPPPAASLRMVISATAPLDPALAAEVERRWGVEVLEIYGATEIGSIASRRTVGDGAWQAYPGIAMAAEADAVAVSAPHAAPHSLADSVELGEAGRFRLLGRHADLVKVGGRRVSLSWLNSVLTGLDGVVDGAFLAPDDLATRPGARLHAFVVAPGRPMAGILGALRREVDPLFLPRTLIGLDRLPRNDFGKLPRGALAQLLPGRTPAIAASGP